MQSFKLKFLGVTILQGVEFPIFLLIFAWALQQCSATALPVMRAWHKAAQVNSAQNNTKTLSTTSIAARTKSLVTRNTYAFARSQCIFAESLLWHCYAVVFSLYFWRPRALDVGRHSKFMLIDWLIDHRPGVYSQRGVVDIAIFRLLLKILVGAVYGISQMGVATPNLVSLGPFRLAKF